jgi:hypothetical protein
MQSLQGMRALLPYIVVAFERRRSMFPTVFITSTHEAAEGVLASIPLVR